MDKNIEDRDNSILSGERETLSETEEKDSIGTLDGSDVQFHLNESSLDRTPPEARVAAIQNVAGAVDASPDCSAVALYSFPDASQDPLEEPYEGRPGFPFQACEVEDMFGNRLFATQTEFQQPTISDILRREADRCARRLQRKRKLFVKPGSKDQNGDRHEEKNNSNNVKRHRTIKPKKQAVPAQKKAWNWAAYLKQERMPAAPVKLFREHQSFPEGHNGFEVGMKLEGLDRTYPSRYYVFTVAEVQGYRIRLHYGGYPDCHDFWVNADSPDIHPVGWCRKTNHKLFPPKGFNEGEFKWASYLKDCKAPAAPEILFNSFYTSDTPSRFRVGMKLEALDKEDVSRMYVATIKDIVENRLLIHFDSRDESCGYWCDTKCPYIHPIGYCAETETPLSGPAGYDDSRGFSWKRYLEETNSQAAPERAFRPRPAHEFLCYTKLEAVDSRNPALIRVATIIDKDDHRIKIHFDGWSYDHDFWVEADSPDIHPVGWCAKTGHTLQVPLGAAERVGAGGGGHVGRAHSGNSRLIALILL